MRLAGGADGGRDLAESIGGELGEEVVFDLAVEAAAKDGQGEADLEVLGALDLHRVPLAAAVRARPLGVGRHVVADVTAIDCRRGVEISHRLGEPVAEEDLPEHRAREEGEEEVVLEVIRHVLAEGLPVGLLDALPGAIKDDVELLLSAVAKVDVVQAGEVEVHEEGEIGGQKADHVGELDALDGTPGGVLGEAGGAKVDVRVTAGDVRVLVVTDVVAVSPGGLVDRDVPGERLGVVAFGAGELVVGAVERRVADLRRLELFVEPQGADAETEGDGLEAEVKEGAAGDLHRAGEEVHALDVADVFGADLGFDAGADGVDGLAEASEPLGAGGGIGDGGREGSRIRGRKRGEGHGRTSRVAVEIAKHPARESGSHGDASECVSGKRYSCRCQRFFLRGKRGDASKTRPLRCGGRRGLSRPQKIREGERRDFALWSLVGGDEADADRVADEARDVVEVELGHDAAAVALDRLDTEVERAGDLGAGAALADELEDLALARRERAVRGGLLFGLGVAEEDLRDGGAQEGLSRGHGANGEDEIGEAGALEEVAGGARADSGAHVLLGRVHREDEDGCLGGLLLDAAGRVDAVEARHREIHQDDVGAEAHGSGEGLVAVGRLTDDLDAALGREERDEALADDCVIFGDEDADGIGRGRHRERCHLTSNGSPLRSAWTV